MRIYSKYHDYYDTAIGYGIDPIITYERNVKVHKWESDVGREVIEHIPDIEEMLGGLRCMRPAYGRENFDLSNILAIIFCGEIHMCVEITKHYPSPSTKPDRVYYCYDVDGIAQAHKNHKQKFETKSKKYTFWKHNQLDRENSIRFFNEFNKSRSDRIIDLNFNVDSPIIVIKKIEDLEDKKLDELKSGAIYLNHCLKDVEFYKVYDAFTAFQELSMFVGGVMGGKVPKTVEISDSDRIAMHGYDKWSFRKMGKNSK